MNKVTHGSPELEGMSFRRYDCSSMSKTACPFITLTKRGIPVPPDATLMTTDPCTLTYLYSIFFSPSFLRSGI